MLTQLSTYDSIPHYVAPPYSLRAEIVEFFKYQFLSSQEEKFISDNHWEALSYIAEKSLDALIVKEANDFCSQTKELIKAYPELFLYFLSKGLQNTNEPFINSHLILMIGHAMNHVAEDDIKHLRGLRVDHFVQRISELDDDKRATIRVLIDNDTERLKKELHISKEVLNEYPSIVDEKTPDEIQFAQKDYADENSRSSDNQKNKKKINYRHIALSVVAITALLEAYWHLYNKKPTHVPLKDPALNQINDIYEVEKIFSSNVLEEKKTPASENLNERYFTEKTFDKIVKSSRIPLTKTESHRSKLSLITAPIALLSLLIWLTRKYWTGMKWGVFARPYRERFRSINTQYADKNTDFSGISVRAHALDELNNKLLVTGISFPHEGGVKARLDRQFSKIKIKKHDNNYEIQEGELLISFRAVGFGFRPSLMLPVPIGYTISSLNGPGRLSKSSLGTYQLLLPFYKPLSKVQYVVKKLSEEEASLQLENINLAAAQYAKKTNRVYDFLNTTPLRKIFGIAIFGTLFTKAINTCAYYFLIPAYLKPSLDHPAISFALNEASQVGVSFDEKYQILKDALKFVITPRESRLVGALVRGGMVYIVSPFGDSRISFDEYLQMIGELNRDASSWLTARLLNRMAESEREDDCHAKTVIVDGFRIKADKTVVSSSRLESNLLTPLDGGVKEVFDYAEVKEPSIEEPKDTEFLSSNSFMRKLRWFIGTTLSSTIDYGPLMKSNHPFRDRHLQSYNTKIFRGVLNRKNSSITENLDFTTTAPINIRWNNSKESGKHVFSPHALDESLLWGAERKKSDAFDGYDDFVHKRSLEQLNQIREYIRNAKNPIKAITTSVKYRKSRCSSKLLSDDLSLEHELVNSEVFNDLEKVSFRNRVYGRIFVAKVLARYISRVPVTSLEEMNRYLEFQNRCFEILGVNLESTKKSPLKYYYAYIFKKFGGLDFIHSLSQLQLKKGEQIQSYFNIFNTWKVIQSSKYLRFRLRSDITSLFPFDELEGSALCDLRDHSSFKSIINKNSVLQYLNLISSSFSRENFLPYLKSGALENAVKYGFNLFRISSSSLLTKIFGPQLILISSNFKDQRAREEFITRFSQMRNSKPDVDINSVFDFQLGQPADDPYVFLRVSDENKIVLDIIPVYGSRIIAFRADLQGLFSREFLIWANQFVDTSIPELCPDKRFEVTFHKTSTYISLTFFLELAQRVLDQTERTNLLRIVNALNEKTGSEKEEFINKMRLTSPECVLIREVFYKGRLDEFIAYFHIETFIKNPSSIVTENLAPGLIRLVKKCLPRKSEAPISQSFKKSSDGYNFHGLREYVHGDSQRFVNNKASARAGKLILNQYEESNATHYRLIVSSEWLMNKGGNDKYGHLITLLSDIVQLSRQNKTVDLYIQHQGRCIFKLSRDEVKDLYHEVYFSSYENPETKITKRILEIHSALIISSKFGQSFDTHCLSLEGVPIRSAREKVELVIYGNHMQVVNWQKRRRAC